MRGLLGTRNPRRASARPRLSVVVPVFEVEEYLGACLDSLRAQSYADFEAVLVDDGSTDGSVAVAEEAAAADPRIRLVRRPHGGLGAARNAGVGLARGEYLTFLDSDDLLPPLALSAMMDTIERTGSDLVVGTLRRDRDGSAPMRLMRENHRTRRERVTLAEMPLMLADVFACNKVFRRSFWESADLEFPVGLRYEDQPTLTRALLAARRFDVIPELVYLWRVRHDRSSITQRRHEVSDLVDRVESKRISTGLILDDGTPEMHDVWFRDVLPVDMWEYFRAVPGSTEEYWSALREAVCEFWSPDTVEFEETRLPPRQRLMGCLVRDGRRDDLERLLEFLDRHRRVTVDALDDQVVVRPGGDVVVDDELVLPVGPRAVV